MARTHGHTDTRRRRKTDEGCLYGMVFVLRGCQPMEGESDWQSTRTSVRLFRWNAALVVAILRDS